MRMFPLALMALACSDPKPEGSAPPFAPDPELSAPNLLILLADDLGQDILPSYGRHPDPPPMPVVDGLAAEGVRFRNAWAYPTCSPARAALLTGRYGRRTGIGRTVVPQTTRVELRTSEVALPRMLSLSPHGYRSIAAGKWHLAGYDSLDGARHPLVMGFEHHDGHMGNLNEPVLDNPSGLQRTYTHYERSSDGVIAWSDRYATTETVDDALGHLQTMAEPWAAYIAFNAPHQPFEIPPAELTGLTADPESIAETYRAMSMAMDTEIGRLLDSLDPGLRARTVVIFAGDNGTSSQGTTAPWRSNMAKSTPYEGGVGVPLIVSGPGVVGGGREVDALVHILDIFATAADLAEVPLEDVLDDHGQPVILDSHSLMPFLVTEDPPPGREYLYTEKFLPNGAPPYNVEWNIFRDQRWKLIVGHNQVDEFFDLVGDPHPLDGNENLNLMGEGNPDPLNPEQQEAYDRLKGELTRFLASAPYEPRTE